MYCALLFATAPTTLTLCHVLPRTTKSYQLNISCHAPASCGCTHTEIRSNRPNTDVLHKCGIGPMIIAFEKRCVCSVTLNPFPYLASRNTILSLFSESAVSLLFFQHSSCHTSASDPYHGLHRRDYRRPLFDDNRLWFCEVAR
jgi:hypothetical protein